MHDLFDFSSIAENANLISLITWLVLCEEHISLGQMIKSCVSGWLTEQRPFQIRRVINLCIPQYWALSNKCLLYKWRKEWMNKNFLITLGRQHSQRPFPIIYLCKEPEERTLQRQLASHPADLQVSTGEIKSNSPTLEDRTRSEITWRPCPIPTTTLTWWDGPDAHFCQDSWLRLPSQRGNLLMIDIIS